MTFNYFHNPLAKIGAGTHQRFFCPANSALQKAISTPLTSNKNKATLTHFQHSSDTSAWSQSEVKVNSLFFLFTRWEHFHTVFWTTPVLTLIICTKAFRLPPQIFKMLCLSTPHVMGNLWKVVLFDCENNIMWPIGSWLRGYGKRWESKTGSKSQGKREESKNQSEREGRWMECLDVFLGMWQPEWEIKRGRKQTREIFLAVLLDRGDSLWKLQ